MSDNDVMNAYLELVSSAEAGAARVNNLLGFGVPRPANPKPLQARLSGGLRDNLFAWLQAAMLPPAKEEPSGWKGLMALNATFSPGVDVIPLIEMDVLRLLEMDEAELLSCLAEHVDLNPANFPDPDADCSHTSIKIGHGWWELLALRCCRRSAQKYVRPMALYEWSPFGLDEMLAGVLQEGFRTQPDANGGDASFIRGDLALGVSFGSGDVTSDIDLERPLHPSVRGAIVGSIPFFKHLYPSVKPARLADGSPAKLMFWRNELNAFCEAVRGWSEIIVFIVPAALDGIGLLGWKGESHNIVLTESRVHELWPAALAYCAGRLDPLLRSGRKISIFMQCSVLTIPLGLMVTRMAQEIPGALVKCYDFGQVLDIALYPDEPGSWIGPWSRRGDVVEHMQQMRLVPFALCEKRT